jgi:uncharacterized repeat protein (TIGR01451 family)
MRKILTTLSLFTLCSAQAVTVQIYMMQQPICSHAIGALGATASGGTAPYSYLWSNGSTAAAISGLVAGTYSVTVTDANAEVATADFTLDAQTEWMIGLGSHNYCAGQGAYGHFSAGYFLGGADPFTTDLSSAFPLTIDGAATAFFNPNMSPAWLGNGYIIETGLPSPVSVMFTDATGCPGTISGQTVGPVEWPAFTSVDIAPSCGPSPNGSITVFRTGGSNSSLHGPNDVTHWDTGNDQEEVFPNLAPGGYWLVQTTRTPGPNSLNWDYLPAAQCGDSIYLVVPDAGPDCGELSGTMYIDANEDCAITSGEIGAGHQILRIEPGPRYASTDLSGNYTANVPLGTYTVTAAYDALQPVCPAVATVASLSIPVDQDVPVLGTAGPAPDLWATLVSGPARPGFELVYSLHASNFNYGASGAVTATFMADAITAIISADPVPDLIAGQTVTWDLPDVPPYAFPWFQVRVQVPADVGLIGTFLSAGWSLSSANMDLNPANNSTTLNTLVTGSYDPNDKLATTSSQGSEALYFIDEDEWIDYTIRFQNTGTDTAFNVLISDTLAATLDPASLRVGAGSHPFTWDLGYGNVIRFRFDDILLPDSNVNEAASHGQVTFRIRPVLPLLPGTMIENIANIFFDFNPPIITEPSVLVAEFSTGGRDAYALDLRVFPNPGQDRFDVQAAGVFSVRVTDLLGREVLRSGWASDRMEMVASALRSGAYVVQVVRSNGDTFQRPWLKN